MDAIKAIADGIRAERAAAAAEVKNTAPVSDEQVVNAVSPSAAENKPAAESAAEKDPVPDEPETKQSEE